MVDQKIRNETMWVWNRLSLLSQADILYMKFKDRWDNGEAMWGSLVIPPTASSYRTFQGWRLGVCTVESAGLVLTSIIFLAAENATKPQALFPPQNLSHQKLHLIDALSKSRWHWWHTGVTQLLDPVNSGKPVVKEGKPHELSCPRNLLW